MDASDLIAAIQGANNAISQLTGFVMQGETDSKTRRWNENMYKQQLADNRHNWEMQNARQDQLLQQSNDYNSPSNQMKRALAAGINPYNTQVSDGNMTYSASSSTPSSASSLPYSPSNPALAGLQAGNMAAQSGNMSVQMSLQTLDALKGYSTLPEAISALKSGYGLTDLDYNYNSSIQQNRINASRNLLDAQAASTANDKAYQLLLSEGISNKAAATFASWKVQREIGRYQIESADLDNKYKQKMLDWYDKMSEANLSKLLSSADLDHASAHKLRTESSFYGSYIRSVIRSNYASAREADSRTFTNYSILPFMERDYEGRYRNMLEDTKGKANVNRWYTPSFDNFLFHSSPRLWKFSHGKDLVDHHLKSTLGLIKEGDELFLRRLGFIKDILF